MHISSNSPSMDEWQVVFARRSARSSCARRISLQTKPSKRVRTFLSATFCSRFHSYFFETPSADSSSHSWIDLTGNLSVQQEGAHRASYKD